jgi:hypothetical protein
MVEGQGIAEDMTFYDSDRGATRVGLSRMRVEMQRLG